MCGPFIHQIDPVIGSIGGVYLWWYGASYTFGFLGAFLWIRRVRASLGYDMYTVYGLTILLASGVLLGGRVVEVIFYEWSYYGDHLWRVPAIWLGGMSTHGILLGSVIAVWVFCRSFGEKFLPVADELAIAGAWIMGLGRLGNFIDGQIAGSITEVCWAVQFPDLEGFRHPVVLYDGIKNLLLVPLLLLIRGRHPPQGVVFGCFIFLYGFLRIFVDFFREYRTEFIGFPPGQEFNILMSVLGIGLLVWAYRFQRSPATAGSTKSPPATSRTDTWVQRVTLVALMLLPLVIPSDWTQDVPERYGARHEGLEHSLIYPQVPDLVENE